jgi:hypothetical protein
MPAKCSAEQLAEYDAQIFDHHDHLIRWADYAMLICGPVKQ